MHIACGTISCARCSIRLKHMDSRMSPRLLRLSGTMTVIKDISSTLVTVGNKITRLRRTAISQRRGELCKKPALKTSRTQKCEFHSVRSSGPKTEAGKARQRESCGRWPGLNVLCTF